MLRVKRERDKVNIHWTELGNCYYQFEFCVLVDQNNLVLALLANVNEFSLWRPCCYGHRSSRQYHIVLVFVTQAGVTSISTIWYVNFTFYSMQSNISSTWISILYEVNHLSNYFPTVLFPKYRTHAPRMWHCNICTPYNIRFCTGMSHRILSDAEWFLI